MSFCSLHCTAAEAEGEAAAGVAAGFPPVKFQPDRTSSMAAVNTSQSDAVVKSTISNTSS